MTYYNAETEGRKRSVRGLIAWLVAVACVLVALTSAVLGARSFAEHDSPSAEFVAQRSVVCCVEALPPGVSRPYMGSGDLKVPTNITAGSYLVTAQEGALGCYFSRRKGSVAVLDGHFDRGGYRIVAIHPSDTTFRISGCAVVAVGL